MDGGGRSRAIGKNNDEDGKAHTKRIRMHPLTMLTLIRISWNSLQCPLGLSQTSMPHRFLRTRC